MEAAEAAATAADTVKAVDMGWIIRPGTSPMTTSTRHSEDSLATHPCMVLAGQEDSPKTHERPRKGMAKARQNRSGRPGDREAVHVGQPGRWSVCAFPTPATGTPRSVGRPLLASRRSVGPPSNAENTRHRHEPKRARLMQGAFGQKVGRPLRRSLAPSRNVRRRRRRSSSLRRPAELT
jgi:hypothetical protein